MKLLLAMAVIVGGVSFATNSYGAYGTTNQFSADSNINFSGNAPSSYNEKKFVKLPCGKIVEVPLNANTNPPGVVVPNGKKGARDS